MRGRAIDLDLRESYIECPYRNIRAVPQQRCSRAKSHLYWGRCTTVIELSERNDTSVTELQCPSFAVIIPVWSVIHDYEVDGNWSFPCQLHPSANTSPS